MADVAFCMYWITMIGYLYGSDFFGNPISNSGAVALTCLVQFLYLIYEKTSWYIYPKRSVTRIPVMMFISPIMFPFLVTISLGDINEGSYILLICIILMVSTKELRSGSYFWRWRFKDLRDVNEISEIDLDFAYKKRNNVLTETFWASAFAFFLGLRSF